MGSLENLIFDFASTQRTIYLYLQPVQQTIHVEYVSTIQTTAFVSHLILYQTNRTLSWIPTNLNHFIFYYLYNPLSFFCLIFFGKKNNKVNEDVDQAPDSTNHIVAVVSTVIKLSSIVLQWMILKRWSISQIHSSFRDSG